MSVPMINLAVNESAKPIHLAVEKVRIVETDAPVLPTDGKVGDILMKTASGGSGASWVTPAQNAEEDNTRPITAAAVYTEIGNINAILATI